MKKIIKNMLGWLWILQGMLLCFVILAVLVKATGYVDGIEYIIKKMFFRNIILITIICIGEFIKKRLD